MQEASAPGARRSNEDRTRTTRAALVAAARTLFVDQGYAATSTPQIAAAAALTRGALYHHYADKQDLFRAVVEAEAAAVAAEIEQRSGGEGAPSAGGAAPGPAAADGAAPGRAAADAARQSLVDGAVAYLDAMAEPGRTRLLLVDAPAVLGAAEADALDARHARRTLRTGLAAALGEQAPTDDRLDALVLVLSAAFDRAALVAALGAADSAGTAGGTASGTADGAGPADAVRWAVTELVDRVCAPRPTR